MKFAIAAVVVLALAMGVQSSVIAGIPGLGLGINGLGLHGLGINGLGLHGLGLGLGVPGPVLAQGPAVLGLGGLHAGLPAAVNIAGGPLLSAHGIPAAVAVAPHASVAALGAGVGVHGASYVAQTRGAVHSAPLPGHIQSAASVNVAPAPGTL